VLPGQIMRKELPPEKSGSVVKFATKKPPERFASIKAGLDVRPFFYLKFDILIFFRSSNTASPNT
jgi:hypothetical protein